VACPDRRVLCLSADGSGMYTAQALWTMARESLNVTTVVFANRDYAVLKREFTYLGIGSPGARAGGDVRDWTSRSRLDTIGEGNGSARHPSELAGCIREGATGGVGREGPTLIEVPL